MTRSKIKKVKPRSGPNLKKQKSSRIEKNTRARIARNRSPEWPLEEGHLSTQTAGGAAGFSPTSWPCCPRENPTSHPPPGVTPNAVDAASPPSEPGRGAWSPGTSHRWPTPPSPRPERALCDAPATNGRFSAPASYHPFGMQPAVRRSFTGGRRPHQSCAWNADCAALINPCTARTLLLILILVHLKTPVYEFESSLQVPSSTAFVISI